MEVLLQTLLIFLCEMIATMKDKNNHIVIPGFYDNVIQLSKEEREDIARAPFSLENYKNSLDLLDVHGESGYSTMERTGIRPTLDVNGIWGGYIGEGAKTVIPSKAYAKISMRLGCLTKQTKRSQSYSRIILCVLLLNQ